MISGEPSTLGSFCQNTRLCTTLGRLDRSYPLFLLPLNVGLDTYASLPTFRIQHWYTLDTVSTYAGNCTITDM